MIELFLKIYVLQFLSSDIMGIATVTYIVILVIAVIKHLTQNILE